MIDIPDSLITWPALVSSVVALAWLCYGRRWWR
jgi:hypothetical protein